MIRRDTLITFETASTVADEYGEEVVTWVSTGQEWASVFYGKGDERRQAAMQRGQQPATFNVLANSMTRAVVVKDRITVGTDVWDIAGIAPMDRASLDITAVRAA